MKTNASVADLRKEYRAHGLREEDVLDDAIAQFDVWFAEALEAEVSEPNAMTLATATASGHPSARIVLLKGIEDEGFVFYTNYESRKGDELAENPHAALVFWWSALERQVRIEGTAHRIDDAVSEAYFQSRPRGSQLGAWASAQSNVVPSREALRDTLRTIEEKYVDRDVPRPPHWGGYCVRPTMIEFWQGRPSRLHDRLRYLRRDDGSWQMDRLAP
jgi:pyridoxamine 5'-phosphate oxidase